MTRLADALERVNPSDRDSDWAAPAVSFPQKSVDRRTPATAPRALERVLPADAPSLLGMPSGLADEWRHDPEVIGKLIGTADFPTPAFEQYRKLAGTLHGLQHVRETRVVMVASALAGEGKSLTSVNLALTLSASYHLRVLLIDADMRRPGIQAVFGVSAVTGLGDGLKAAHDRVMPVTQVADRLFVLPAGRPDGNPLSGLTSPRMARLTREARDAFDWVLIDTPPVSLMPDATLLANCVDGMVLVVRPGRAPFQIVRRIIDTLGPDHVLGVVLNAVDDWQGRHARGYYDYYASGDAGATRST